MSKIGLAKAFKAMQKTTDIQEITNSVIPFDTKYIQRVCYSMNLELTLSILMMVFHRPVTNQVRYVDRRNAIAPDDLNAPNVSSSDIVNVNGLKKAFKAIHKTTDTQEITNSVLCSMFYVHVHMHDPTLSK